MKTKALTTAHKVRQEFDTWSEACSFGWKKTKLYTNLKKGKYSFTFIKKNGEVRKANGEIREVEGKSNRKVNHLIQKYYDLDKDAWRSLDVRRLANNLFKVQRMYIYGWDDAFFSDDNGEIPTLFNTSDQAEAEIKMHLEDMEYAIEQGYIDADNLEERKDFRVISLKL